MQLWTKPVNFRDKCLNFIAHAGPIQYFSAVRYCLADLDMNGQGSLISRSFAILRANWGTLLIATGWPYLLLAMGFMSWGIGLRMHYANAEPVDPVTLWQHLAWSSKLAVIIAYLASGAIPPTFSLAGVTIIVWAHLENGKATVADVFRGIGKIFFRLLLLGLCIYVPVQMAGAFFIVPGIILALLFSFAVPELVVQRAKVSAALGQSTSLAYKKFGTLALIYLAFVAVAFFLIMIMMVVFAALFNFELPWWTRTLPLWIGIAFLAPWVVMIFGTMVVLTYRDAIEQRQAAAATDNPLPMNA
ncbi:MAG TPA: hypothetical protein VLK33_08465 [Terriglobales bacterium]|nr:hypothetical protein [Terriglobales bacterium]